MDVKAIAQHERGGLDTAAEVIPELIGPAPADHAHSIPDDLHDWVETPVLLALAQNAAQTQGAELLRPVFSLTSTRFYHPWRMLALLTYAYGRGLWSSEEIAHAAFWDDALRELCRGVPPSSDLIRRFRERNRAVLQRCLDRIIRGACGWGREGRETPAHPRLAVEVLCDVHRRLHRAERRDAASATWAEREAMMPTTTTTCVV